MTEEEFKSWLSANQPYRTILVEAVANIDGDETVILLSNNGYVDLATNEHYSPYINGGVSFSERVNLDGSATSGAGDIELSNLDHRLDSWYDFVWTNRPITVWLGDKFWPRDDFRKIFDGVVSDIQPNGDNFVIAVLNKLDRLNKPANENKLGGTTINKDKLIPFGLGEIHNAEPLLLDNDQTYQIHNGPIEHIIEVRDNGGPRAGADITADLANGKFQITGGKALGQITVSFQGYKDPTYYNDIANLIRILVTEYGSAETRFTDADIDLDNFADFTTAHPAPVGVYIADATSVLTYAQQLAGSVGAQVVCSTLGKLRLVQLAMPTGIDPGIEAGEKDFFQNELKISERTAVRSGSKLGYCRNYTVQTNGLNSGLPQTSLDLFAKEWLTITRVDDPTKTLYKLTAEPEQEDTLLLVESDAIIETERRRDFWKVPRYIYTAKYRMSMMLTELGDTMTLKYKYFGLQAGKRGLVVSIERDWFNGTITIGVLI